MDERSILCSLNEPWHSGVRAVATQTLVGDEEESAILAAVDGTATLAKARQVDWPTEAAAELIDALLDAYGRGIVDAAILVEGIQTRTVILEKEAAVKIVRAVL